VLKWQGRCEDAIPEYETALALSPNWVNSLNLLAWCKFMTGSIEEAIPFEERAIRLSPSVPYIRNLYNEIGIIHLLLLRPDEAIVFWFEKARSPLLGWPYSFLAAIYALRGETEKAAANLAEARRLYHDGRYSSIARRKATGVGGAPGYGGVPKVAALSAGLCANICAFSALSNEELSSSCGHRRRREAPVDLLRRSSAAQRVMSTCRRLASPFIYCSGMPALRKPAK
jgi:tetratricopeptide (TPR) repeat protein